MSIADPLRQIYESGGLLQQCDACQWAQRGHRSEIVECPTCGAALVPPIAIMFGGVAVVYTGKDFHFYSRGSGVFVSVERADYCEVIQFMCRHAEELRTGTIIHDGGIPRRIPWRRQFTEHLFKKE